MADSEDDPSTRRWCHTSLRRVLVSEGCWAILLVENPKVCVHFGSWIALRGPRKWALALKRDGYANDTLSGDKQKSCCSWRTQKVWKRCFVWSDAELRLFSQVLAGGKVTGAAGESKAPEMEPPPPPPGVDFTSPGRECSQVSRWFPCFRALQESNCSLVVGIRTWLPRLPRLTFCHHSSLTATLRG